MQQIPSQTDSWTASERKFTAQAEYRGKEQSTHKQLFGDSAAIWLCPCGGARRAGGAKLQPAGLASKPRNRLFQHRRHSDTVHAGQRTRETAGVVSLVAFALVAFSRFACHTCRAIDTAEIKTCRFNRIMTFFFVLASSTRNNVMAKPSRTKRAQRKRRHREWEQKEEDIAAGLKSPIQIQKRPKKKPSKHIQTGCEKQPTFKRRKRSNKRNKSNADTDV